MGGLGERKEDYGVEIALTSELCRKRIVHMLRKVENREENALLKRWYFLGWFDGFKMSFGFRFS